MICLLNAAEQLPSNYQDLQLVKTFLILSTARFYTETCVARKCRISQLSMFRTETCLPLKPFYYSLPICGSNVLFASCAIFPPRLQRCTEIPKHRGVIRVTVLRYLSTDHDCHLKRYCSKTCLFRDDNCTNNNLL